jgi:polar amino acid transport system substrate-binding protein
MKDNIERPGRRAVIAAGAGLLAALASGRARAASSSWQKIMDSGVVRFGVMPSHGPYHDLQGGKWVGCAIQMGLDCMAALSEAMKKPLRDTYVETSLANVILDLQADNLDLYFGLTESEERRRAITLFGPIYALPECAINGRGFNPGDSWAAYDKPSVSVSVVMGSTDEQAAQKMLPHADIRSMKSTAEAILDVQSGNSKAMINTLLSGMMAKKNTPNLGDPVVLQPLFSQPSAGGTRKDGDGRFGTFLEQWAKSYRASGRAKQVILDAMQHFGLDTTHLPPTLEF